MSNAQFKLSQGCMLPLHQGKIREGVEPIVQIINVKKVATKTGRERYRVVVSDGQYYQQAMIGSQLSEKIEKNEVRNMCVIRVKDSVTNVIQNRRILIILGLEVVGYPDDILGQPKNLDTILKGGNVPDQRQQNIQSPQRQQPQRQQTVQRQQTTEQVRNVQQKIPPKTQTRGKRAISNLQNSAIQPIASLNMYQPSWTIKARCTLKTNIKKWSKDGREGQLASINLVDDQGGEIRAVMFNKAVDAHYNKIHEGGVYLISGGSLKHAKKQFSGGIKNDLEITLGEFSQVQPVEDDANIPGVSFSITPLANLKDLEKDEYCDVVGVVTAIYEPKTYTSRKNTQFTKQTIVLADKNPDRPEEKITVNLSIFGDENPPKLNFKEHDVVAVKAVKKSDFGEVSLTGTSETKFIVNPPDIKEACDLKAWYEKYGKNAMQMSLSKSKSSSTKATLADIEKKQLGMGDAVVVTVRATVTFIKKEGNICYPACPNENCKGKKLQKNLHEESDKLTCPTCGTEYSENSDEIDYRYQLSLIITDHTGHRWVTAFNNSAATILGNQSAAEMIKKQMENPEEFEEDIDEANFKTYNFRIRCKESTRGSGDSMIQCTLMQAWPVESYEKECQSLLAEIAKYD